MFSIIQKDTIELDPFTITSSTDAGTAAILTASGRVRLRGLVMAAGIDHSTTDLTDATVDSHSGSINSVIPTAVAGDLSPAKAQVGYSGGDAGIILEDGESVYLTLTGGGVDTVSLTVYARYTALTYNASLQVV